jgi:hypothetical protein
MKAQITSLAWSKFTLQGSIAMQLGDIAAAPDGTLYAIIADKDNNIGVYKFQSGSDVATRIKQKIGAPAKGNSTAADLIDSLGGVSIKGNFESMDPKISISPSGEVVVAYRDNAKPSYTIYYQRKKADAKKFENAIAVSNGIGGGVAIDHANNVHVVWYQSDAANPGGFYRKYDANDTLVIDTQTLSTYHDAEPEVAVDSKGNAHIVYMTGILGDSNTADTRYRRVSASGKLGKEIEIALTPGPSIYPDIAVGPDDTLHIAWQGKESTSKGELYQPYYRHWDNKASDLSKQKRLQKSTTGSGAVDVTACGSGPYVTWYNRDSEGLLKIWVSENQGTAQALTEGSFHASVSAAGFVHILFKDASGNAAYLRRADESCMSA